MTTEDRTRLVAELLAGPCNEIAHRIFHVNSCIAQTRICLDVLEHFGILAAPMPVKAEAHNDLMMTSLRMKLPAPINGSVTVAINGTGNVDKSRPGEPWDGHIVCWIPQPRMLLDPTVGQFGKPEWGIPLPLCILLDLDADPSYADFDPFSDDPDNYVVIEGDSGEVVVYSPLVDIDHASWQQSPNWQDADGIVTHLSSAFIHYITEQLAGRTATVMEVQPNPQAAHGFTINVTDCPQTVVSGAIFSQGHSTYGAQVLATAAALHRDR